MDSKNSAELLIQDSFRAAVRSTISHWAHYWRFTKPVEVAALAPKNRAYRVLAIEFIYDETDQAVDRMVKAVANHPSIEKLACYHQVTEAIIQTAVNELLGKPSAAEWFLPRYRLDGLLPALISEYTAEANQGAGGEAEAPAENA